MFHFNPIHARISETRSRGGGGGQSGGIPHDIQNDTGHSNVLSFVHIRA